VAARLNRPAAVLLDLDGADLTRALPWQPGALDLLTLIRWAGVPCPLVTMRDRAWPTSSCPPSPRVRCARS
jgi:hypothetical protein